jgi:hypothetical protein
MKKILFAICFFGATAAAFGQSSANAGQVSNEPVITQFTSHPQFASQQPMSIEKSLFETSSFTAARGERPLWEFATPSMTTPLGDSARALKKEHQEAKKADIVWSN